MSFRHRWRVVLILLGITLLVGSRSPLVAVSLNEAYRTALENNEEIFVSKEREQQAEEGVVTAKSRLYPELNVSGQAVKQKELTQQLGATSQTFQPERNHQYEFELRHRLYHGGKTWFGWSLRSLEAREESFRHYRRRQEILFEVARRYYGVLLAQRNLEIARNTLTRSENQLDRAQGRFEVGEVTKTSVLRSEVSVSRSRQTLRNARNDLDVAYQRLGLAMGHDTAPDSVEAIEFDEFSGDPVESFYRRALESRRDLRRAKTNVKAAAERVKWEKADYFPSIDIVSQFSESDKPRFSDQTQNWNVQLVGSYPIFTGWRETAEVDQARSQYRAAQAQYDRLKKEVRIEIRNIYLDLESQRKVIETARSEVESAKQNFEQMSAEFDQGLVTSVDVNDALQALQEAESRLANARYNFQLDLIRLRLASGVFKQRLLNRTSNATS